MWESRTSGGRAGTLSGILIGGLFLLVAALIFGGIYLLVSGPVHFAALLTIGFLSLVFAGLSYFAQALSRTPTAQRAAAWGFGAFGFAVLFLTVGLFPYFYPSLGLLSLLAQFVLLIVLLLLLIGAVGLAFWRARGRAQDQQREASRQEWSHSSPPSAFSYAAARDPSAAPPSADEAPRGGAERGGLPDGPDVPLLSRHPRPALSVLPVVRGIIVGAGRPGDRRDRHRVRVVALAAGPGSPPVDIRQRVDDDRGFLKRLQLLVPGYRGYRQGEDARAADSFLRLQVADKVHKATQVIIDCRQRMTQSGQFQGLMDLPPMLADLQQLEGEIRHAEQGYTGISPALRINPQQIDRLYEYDYGFAQAADQVTATLAPLQASASGTDSAAVQNAIATVRGQVRQLDSAFKARVRAIEGILV